MTREEYKRQVIAKGTACGNPPKYRQIADPKAYPQGYFKEKPCKQCGSLFIPKSPSELTCSEKCRASGIVSAYFQRNYRINLEEYLDIAEEQGFVCAICGRPNFAMRKHHTGSLVVDHCHLTGKVRGLLCHNCNRALGLLQDNIEVLEKAVSYLKGATTIPGGSRAKRLEAHTTHS